MSSAAKPVLKPLSMATNGCLISGPSYFSSKKASDSRVSLSPTLKPIKLQVSYSYFSSNSSPIKISFKRKEPILKVYVITAPQEENNPVFVEEEGEGFKADFEWEAPANEESYGSVEISEEAKVYVGNFPYDVDGEKLAQLFGQAGIVEIAEVIYNRETDQSRGFGFVTMSTVEEAEKAVQMFHRYNSKRLVSMRKSKSDFGADDDLTRLMCQPPELARQCPSYQTNCPSCLANSPTSYMFFVIQFISLL